MNRQLLDTNIYGLLVVDKDFHLLHSKLEELKQSKELLVYGFDVIKKELKAAPRKKIAGINPQATLLRAYSSFTFREYAIEYDFQKIAEEYYSAYVKLGGGLPKSELINDFLIVACASRKCINIVVSEDNATMLSELSRKAYLKVNQQMNISLPAFTGYEKFKKYLLGAGLPNPIIDNSNKLGIFLSIFNIFPLIHFGFFVHKLMKEKHIYKHFVDKG